MNIPRKISSNITQSKRMKLTCKKWGAECLSEAADSTPSVLGRVMVFVASCWAASNILFILTLYINQEHSFLLYFSSLSSIVFFMLATIFFIIGKKHMGDLIAFWYYFFAICNTILIPLMLWANIL